MILRGAPTPGLKWHPLSDRPRTFDPAEAEFGSGRVGAVAARTHSFICYSSADGADFALRLAAALEGGEPSFGVWLDVYEKQRGRLRPGEYWDDQIAEGIRTCEN